MGRVLRRRPELVWCQVALVQRTRATWPLARQAELQRKPHLSTRHPALGGADSGELFNASRLNSKKWTEQKTGLTTKIPNTRQALSSDSASAVPNETNNPKNGTVKSASNMQVRAKRSTQCSVLLIPGISGRRQAPFLRSRHRRLSEQMAIPRPNQTS